MPLHRRVLGSSQLGTLAWSHLPPFWPVPASLLALLLGFFRPLPLLRPTMHPVALSGRGVACFPSRALPAFGVFGPSCRMTATPTSGSTSTCATPPMWVLAPQLRGPTGQALLPRLDGTSLGCVVLWAWVRSTPPQSQAAALGTVRWWLFLVVGVHPRGVAT